MFEYTHLDLGVLLPKQSKTIEFPYKDITVVSLSASCGCSDVVDIKEDNKVRVTVTASEKPLHLIYKDSLTSEKSVIVKYHLGDPNNVLQTTLTFKLTVKYSK